MTHYSSTVVFDMDFCLPCADADVGVPFGDRFWRTVGFASRLDSVWRSGCGRRYCICCCSQHVGCESHRPATTSRGEFLTSTNNKPDVANSGLEPIH